MTPEDAPTAPQSEPVSVEGIRAPVAPSPTAEAPQINARVGGAPADAMIVVPVRQTVLCPEIVFPITINRPMSVQAAQAAIREQRQVLVLAALPGVDVAKVEAAIEDGVLVIAGQRAAPPELRTAIIHRLELPQGRFERRVPLPPGRYLEVRRSEAHGCLVISLSKAQ